MAATERQGRSRRHARWLARLAAALSCTCVAAFAATLPEDLAELMYHSYDGGGVQVTGPALKFRKGFADDFSASATYYVDSITSASIDVVTSASPYTERRDEIGLALDWLKGNSLMTVGYLASDENDYESGTWSIGVAQDFFGGMSTVTLGYMRGDDTVSRVDTDFEDGIERNSYALGWSQVLTPKIVASLDYEAILETGFLNNPYRSARVLGAQVPEQYPRARNSHSVALRGIGMVSEATAVELGYRWFRDTWQVQAHTLEAALARRVRPGLTAEVSLRYYAQDAASFYSDNFDAVYEFMARDKELSTFNSTSAGVRLTWDLGSTLGPLSRSSVSFGYDFINFDYDDFTDIRNGELYGFDSHVFQVWFGGWW
ncbi:MAG TPA: DUF3570 domain-containing protein [Gammaproteobacteria bacterium]|nr:DUF3570 domain-containing protein [Gammaproteobacteria bacterium]HRP86983.1 DUF3570 domain-containing protein [Gammaproteobacteria bacterium]